MEKKLCTNVSVAVLLSCFDIASPTKKDGNAKNAR